MSIYILRAKHIDIYGEDPELWEDKSYTEDHDTAIAWMRGSKVERGSTMDEHRDYIKLENKALVK